MRILIAPDSFKGSLSAIQASEAMATGIRDATKDAEIQLLPLADGGEGTLEILSPYISYSENHVIIDNYIIYADELSRKTMAIESARFIGLNHPIMREINVFERGSGDLGNCILSGLDLGIRRFVIGLGGSATNDIGLGLLISLGLIAKDEQGRSVTPDLRGLLGIRSIDRSEMDPRIIECTLTVLCDVDAPLCGPTGATFSFGQQKGLTHEHLPTIDNAAEFFADLAESGFGKKARNVSGSGAAGGLGFSFALLGGRLVSGADYVIKKMGLKDRIKDINWVVTGEGRSDAQTLQGKLPAKVAVTAHNAGSKVALISGDIIGRSELSSAFDAMISARPKNMSIVTSMDQAAMLLRQATCKWAKAFL